VHFDLRSTAPWPQRMFRRTEIVGVRADHIAQDAH
jgi:hypothetical protein